LDVSNYLAASTSSLAFYKRLGGLDAISGYVVPMLEWAQKMLAEALGTSKMDVPKSMEAPFMRLVCE
jgi:hypothetical protein